MQLLNARLQAKRLARSSNQTMIQALDNNPLKFSPTAEDALRIMFGPAEHELSRCAPGAGAELRRPEGASDQDLCGDAAGAAACWSRISIRRRSSASTDADGGIAASVGSRKAQAVGRLRGALAGEDAAHDGGLIDAFMHYFAECYDRSANEVR